MIVSERPSLVDREEISRAFEVLAVPGACIELRTFAGAGRTTAGFFDASSAGKESFISSAFSLSADPATRAVYATMNPVDAALLTRRRNAVARAGKDSLTKDSDIVRRRWLLIDCDPARGADCSATDSEKSAAQERAEWLQQWLSLALDWPSPVVADSGNGWHLLYHVDLPADDGGLVNRVLKSIGQWGFTDTTVKIDTTVSNASRIVKLYGTASRKGQDTPERPHRASRLVDVPRRLGLVTREQLEELAALSQPPAAEPSQSRKLERAWNYIDKIPRSISGQRGHNQLFEAAWRLVVGFGLAPADAKSLLARWNVGCIPLWSDVELNHKIAQAEQKAVSEAHRVGELLRCADAASEPAAGVIESPDDPHRLARVFLRRHGTDSQGEPTLLVWRDEFYRWVSPAWRLAPLAEVKSLLIPLIKDEFDQAFLAARNAAIEAGDDLPTAARKVTRSIVENVLMAVSAQRLAPHNVDQPCWLRSEADDPLPSQVLVTRNGLLVLPRGSSDPLALQPASPRLFTLNAVDYAFDSQAQCPEWLKFVRSLWPDDPQSIETLQEWFGYLVSGETAQQKLLMLQGPPRSGKGTIGRALKRLIGPQNLASPTLSSLSEQFGLQGLLGKSAALVADARLSGRADAVAVVERLLSITGEDPQDVQRKHQSTLTGVRLGARFTLLTNETPNLQDSAGAVMTRVILLRLMESFAGREDRGLDERLATELPGILLWSIAGLRRLRERGRLIQPESGRELLDDLASMSNPVGLFIHECCDLNATATATASDLWRAWRMWASQHGLERTGTQQTFGRDLRTVLPKLRISQIRAGEVRQRVYTGIRLKR